MELFDDIKKCPLCGTLTRDGKPVGYQCTDVALMNVTNSPFFPLTDVREMQLEEQRRLDRAAAALIP